MVQAQPVRVDVLLAAEATPTQVSGDDLQTLGHVRGNLTVSKDWEHPEAFRTRAAAALLVDAGAKRVLCSHDCQPGPQVDFNATWSASHYALGRVSLGWRGGLTSGVVSMGSAWGANPIGADECAAVLRCPLPRSRFGLTGESVTYGTVTLAGQLAYTGQGAAGALRASHVSGGTAVAVALAGAGERNWVLPIAATMHWGRWRIFGSATAGENGANRGWHGSIGAATPLAGGELRLGGWRYRIEQEPAVGKLAAGWRRALSTRTGLHFDLAAAQASDGRRWTAAAIGIEHVLR